MFSLSPSNKKQIPFAIDRKFGSSIFLHEDSERNVISGEDLFPFIENDSERIFISGPSGSGKSTFAAGLMKIYKKVFPKNRIIIFSSLKEDGQLDAVKGTYRINLDRIMTFAEEMSEKTEEQEEKKEPEKASLPDHDFHEPVQESEEEKEEKESEEEKMYYTLDATFYRNTFVLFDDVDTMQDSDMGKKVLDFRNFLLEQHRHFNIYLVCTTHILMNYVATKRLLNEAQKVVVFPKSGNISQVTQFLTRYVGFDKNEVQKFLKSDPSSRWKLVYKCYPNYVMSQHLIY